MATVEHYEHVFLGGGKGGKSLAMELAQAGHKVAVIERGMIGGSCINVACIPTKTLIQNARIAHIQQQQGGAATDMAAVSQRVKAVVDGMVELNHDAFRKSGLELVLGTGRFVGPRRIEVKTNDGALRVIEGDHAYINTGTTAAIPDLPGLRAAEPLTHVEALVLTTLPEHLIVIGGGYIGLEMAQAFQRLGSKVTLLQNAPRVATREDEDVSDAIEAALKEDGIDIRTGAKPTGVTGTSGRSVTVALEGGDSITGTHILVAAGRTPVTSGIGLDAAGVELDARGFIKTDERLATTAERTWAIGEVAGTPMFTHASFDDYRVLRSQLAGGNVTTKDRIIPYALFIEPELGRIGLNESEARAKGIAVRVVKLPMAAVPRARTNGATKGFMKMLIDAQSDAILGFTMLGTNAGDVVTAVQMAMLGGLPYQHVRDAIIAHPLISEGLNILLAKVPERTAS
ncbi:Pyruvate/2-oxoglutarate dehydrogenase complex, dihydrolipoamide dehydrogenase (E3) component [Paraburkholderia sabiae]|uniref:FAD-dependent oxidoreductase n=1 Tax=Paraburkholderia sabiae TaxID=273251 RepID=UPI001CAF258A|nr:FAD-dependent oxidoreductase [Paraburkholderia sabiae]CAG9203585.1 Pyruvate/2-oxoglutarate dehydrogenase complex, dihydrolipoamide dehydrogenase (E3) component [Paraburkholderia sabiae]